MEQPRQGIKEKPIIIGNQSKLRFSFDVFLTLFFWGYSVVIIVFFASATFGLDNAVTETLHSSFNSTNNEIRLLILIALVMFTCFYLLLSMNRIYNKKRFGILKRRIYPTDVTIDDLKELNLMDIETIHQLQKMNYIIFEENPIVSLETEKNK
jgi:hypothetical protein